MVGALGLAKTKYKCYVSSIIYPKKPYSNYQGPYIMILWLMVQGSGWSLSISVQDSRGL